MFQHLNEKAKRITGIHQWPYKAVAKALEVIPRTLIQNCGANTIRTITALRVSLIQIWLWSFIATSAANYPFQEAFSKTASIATASRRL